MTQNIDQNEVNKFADIAEKWWDPTGGFKPLHVINPLRANYINNKSPDIVYSFGELIAYTSKQLFDSNINTKHFKKVSKMIEDIKLNIIKGDAIYFKASRSLEFEKIINTI